MYFKRCDYKLRGILELLRIDRPTREQSVLVQFENVAPELGKDWMVDRQRRRVEIVPPVVDGIFSFVSLSREDSFHLCGTGRQIKYLS